MKKIINILLFILIMPLMFYPCIFRSDYRTNYLRKFKPQLKDAFGNFEVTKKERIKYSGGAPIPTYGSFYKWEIKYTDKDGNISFFMLDNNKKSFSKKATEQEYFTYQISNKNRYRL